jgi:hypothetical protein
MHYTFVEKLPIFQQLAGIGRATAHRWMQDPVVVQRLTEARRDATKAIMAKLRLAAGEAVDCLREVQRDGESESARVSAARCILEQTMRAAEIQDLAEGPVQNNCNRRRGRIAARRIH